MSDQKRLFFALPLPADLQQQIIEWRAAHFAPDAGRPIAAANLHITLAFLGDVSAQKQRTLSALAGRIQQPGFTLRWTTPGTGPARRSSGLAPASRRAACCSSRIYCARRRHAAVAHKARNPFIRMSHYCVTLSTRSGCRRQGLAGSFRCGSLCCMNRDLNRDVPVTSRCNAGL